MSLLTARALRSIIPRPSTPLRPAIAPTTIRSLHPSVRRAALSESDHSERQRELSLLPTSPILPPHKDIKWIEDEEEEEAS